MKKIMYYDRQFKSWVSFLQDDNGFQVSEAIYTYTKAEAKALKITDFTLYA